jgi:hypothetical protein
MPSYKVLKAAVAGLARAYLSYYGPMSLAPKRSEPMKFSMVRELYAIPSSHNSPVRVGNLQWSDADHHVFMFRRLILLIRLLLGGSPGLPELGGECCHVLVADHDRHVN